MNENPKLATVRKLLAKAENPAATEAEAEAYNAKAAQLIAEYGIDRALLATEAPELDVVGDKVVLLDNPYARDKATLLAAIVHALGGKCVLRTRYPEGVKQLSIHMFGHASTLERIDLLYTSLLLQAANGMQAARPRPGESVAAFRRSWLSGFTWSVSRRLDAAEKQAAADRPEATTETGATVSTALVLADRGAEVAQAYREAYPKVGRGRSRRLSGSGRMAGYAAGERANLHASARVGGRASGALAS